MAVSAYRELIIKDAEYLRVATDNARRGDGPQIKAATAKKRKLARLKRETERIERMM